MEMYHLFCTVVSTMMCNLRALTGSADSWERLGVCEFSDPGWRQNFRMRRQSFTKLCGLLEGFMAPMKSESDLLFAVLCMLPFSALGSCAQWPLPSPSPINSASPKVPVHAKITGPVLFHSWHISKRINVNAVAEKSVAQFTWNKVQSAPLTDWNTSEIGYMKYFY